MENYARITITLSSQEYLALVNSAKEDIRPPRDHLRFLVKQALHQQGFLPTNESSAVTTREGQHGAAQSSAPLQSIVNLRT